MRRSTSFRGIAGSMRSMPMKYCSYSARKRSRRFSSSSSATSTSAFSTASALQGGDGEVVEAGRDLPVVEAEMLVAFSGQRVRVLQAQDLDVVYEVTDGLAVSSLYLKAIRAIRKDRLRARVGFPRLDAQFGAVGGVLVEPGQDVHGVLPAPENDDVARGVSIRRARRGARAVPPSLGFEVAFRGRAGGFELDTRVHRQTAPQPGRMIVSAADAQPAVLQRPAGAGDVPIQTDVAAIEALCKALAELWVWRCPAGVCEVSGTGDRCRGAAGSARAFWALLGHARAERQRVRERERREHEEPEPHDAPCYHGRLRLGSVPRHASGPLQNPPARLGVTARPHV